MQVNESTMVDWTSTSPILSKADQAQLFIRPRALRGAAFSTAAAGDLRSGNRSRFAAVLGLGTEWATVRQVHGAHVRRVHGPGMAGNGDAMFTNVRSLPLAVFTADCAGVVVEAADAVGVAHAGWRGVAAGVAAALLAAMETAGHTSQRAAIGPTIGPCCYEVGPDVAGLFPGFIEETRWGTPSVDLVAALRSQLDGLDVTVAGGCTMCHSDFHSHRRDRTEHRMATVGWRP